MQAILDDASGDDLATARRLWQAAEVLHGVVYFHPAALEVIGASGTKGFWMGYVTTRMAPLGPIGPEVATAVCFGFAPARLHRALPDGWEHLPPERALEVRAQAATTALESMLPTLDVAAVLERFASLVAHLDPIGRALGAANQAVGTAPVGPHAGAPMARLWQATTTLREHRGDAHNALLLAAGLDGCSANVLAAAVRGEGAGMLRRSRAWDEERWDAAVADLAACGLVEGVRGDDTDGVVATDAGRALHRRVELDTDALAWRSYLAGATPGAVHELLSLLEPPCRTVFAQGFLPQPNPIGLTAPV